MGGYRVSRSLLPVVVGLAVFSAGLVACSARLPAPSSPVLSVEPGMVRIDATWVRVSGASLYRVQWRFAREGFAEENSLLVEGSSVSFDVPRQGWWVVGVAACDDSGCGQMSTSEIPVVINVMEHQAIRVDLLGDSIWLEWDPLPGLYRVDYRFTTDEEWRTTRLRSETSFNLGEEFESLKEDIAAWKQEPGFTLERIRVSFNCDEDGTGCKLLGSIPNNTMERVEEPVRDPYPTATLVGGTPHPLRVQDPATGELRSDLTLTYEIRADGHPVRCASRPPENAAESIRYGGLVKRCSPHSSFQVDPDAEFPNGAKCGLRPAEEGDEPTEYGNRVKVCYEVLPFEEVNAILQAAYDPSP